MNPTVDSMSSEKDPKIDPGPSYAGVQTIQDLLTRYIGQMVDGCGSPKCVRTLCHTGRCNSSKAPVRKYTPRSARTIALTLISGPRPRARLCDRYERRAISAVEVSAPRDPTALVQQLHDTEAIRAIASSTTPAPALQARSDLEFELCSINQQLDDEELNFSFSRPMSLRDILDESEGVSRRLVSAMHATLELLPKANQSQWTFISHAIHTRRACPPPTLNDVTLTRELHEQCLAILDAMDHQPTFRTFCRIFNLISRWHEMELSAYVRESPESNLSIDDFLFRSFARDSPSLYRHFKVHISEVGLNALALFLWTRKAFLDSWDEGSFIRDASKTSCALQMCEIVSDACEKQLQDQVWQAVIFNTSAATNELPVEELARTWLETEDCSLRRSHALNELGLIHSGTGGQYFRMLCFLRQKKAHSEADVVFSLRMRQAEHQPEPESTSQLAYLEEHYLLLSIRRDHVLLDAFNELWHVRRGGLLRPLRVRLGEMDELEIGHDLGGVQIEFFNLVCRELLRESAQIFTTNLDTGMSSFCVGSLQPLHIFELCGLLFALALYNGIALPINLADPLYFFLLDRPILTDDGPNLETMWPAPVKSLRALAAAEEDDAGMDYVFPVEANGVRLAVKPPWADDSDEDSTGVTRVAEATAITHHQGPHAQPRSAPSVDLASLKWPGWSFSASASDPEPITSQNKKRYVYDYLNWLGRDSILPQLMRFKRGFDTVFPSSHTLGPMSPRSLRDLLEGSADLDFAALRAATTYDGYVADSDYIQSFWRIVSSWDKEHQWLLVKFVTACERVPAGGSGLLTFKISRTEELNGSLPTSSTCFGTLNLPKYRSTEILERKLQVAVEYGAEGFGTG